MEIFSAAGDRSEALVLKYANGMSTDLVLRRRIGVEQWNVRNVKNFRNVFLE